MVEISIETLVMAVQAIDAEISYITDSVDGDLKDLPTDDQEMLLAYSKAAMELKARYQEIRESEQDLPPYEQLVGDE
jgi:hypothetical protein